MSLPDALSLAPARAYFTRVPDRTVVRSVLGLTVYLDDPFWAAEGAERLLRSFLADGRSLPFYTTSRLDHWVAHGPRGRGAIGSDHWAVGAQERAQARGATTASKGLSSGAPVSEAQMAGIAARTPPSARPTRPGAATRRTTRT